MSHSEIIVSDELKQNHLKITKLDEDYWRVGLRSSGMESSSVVYIYTDSTSFLNFLVNVSVEHRGWEGDKKWSSLENDFLISLKNKGMGYVEATMQLNNSDSNWKSECNFEIILSDILILIEKFKVLF